jgi:secretion/DNA translocation related TadE-like protein
MSWADLLRLRGADRDRGSATVYAAFALVALTALGVIVSGFTALASAKHRAAGAADLAALAGAQALQRGADPCASAADLAVRNGAVLAGCAVAGQVVTVIARTDGPHLLGRAWTFESVARAGPATAGVDPDVAQPRVAMQTFCHSRVATQTLVTPAGSSRRQCPSHSRSLP